MEVILAIIIVSSSLTLLAYSVSLLSLADDEENCLRVQCDELIDSILDDTDLKRGECLIEYSAICKLESSPMWDESINFRLAIVGVHPEETMALIERGDSYEGGERYSRTIPVNIYYSPRDVRIALIVVWVW